MSKKMWYPELRDPAYRRAQLTESTTMYAPLLRAASTLRISGPAYGLKIAVIPDTQARSGDDFAFLECAGKYIAAKRPDVVLHLGDLADMESLSTHEKDGHIRVEGTRYKDDLAAAQQANEALMSPIEKARAYKPTKILTYGNHENRIVRAIDADPRHLADVYSLDDLRYADYGWKCYPFLQPVVIGGVAFCHYFPRGVMDKPIQSPAILLRALHMSAVAGHQQGRDIAFGKRADGQPLTAIISGSFYEHNERYLSPFSNQHWRGMWMLHEVKDGAFDEMALSINYLRRRFG